MNQSSTSVGINLRNKGLRSTTGSLIKGCVKDATTKLSIGSIPSNYQTIIYQHNSMKAFGSSQKRFYQESKNDLQKTTIPNESNIQQTSPKKNVSHSTKGYGPFIAKQQRNWISKNCSPGPGRYEYSKTAEQSVKRQKNKLYTRDKKQNNQKILLQYKANQTQSPGPGQYYVFEQKSSNNGWKSAFKSKLNRSAYIQNTNALGPGYYDINQEKNYRVQKRQNKQNTILTQKFSSNKLIHPFQNSQQKNEIPGPGSYEYQIPSFKPLYERIKISSNFMMSKKDRFNGQTDKFKTQQIQEQTPNIYSYNKRSVFDQQKRLLKWPCFMSESKRITFGGQKKLGPSFLTPKIQNKRNFHFNIKGQWL